jgi:mono/diheme cytochrome c family protein
MSIKSRGMRWLWSISLGVATAAAAASAQNAPHRGDPQAGHQLAVRACDTCHIVAANQEIRPLVPGYAPSFFDVAKKPGITAQSLEEFLAHGHPYAKMPYPELTSAQVTEIVSYILSLRGRH